MPVRVTLAVDKVALQQGFLPELRFSLANISRLMLNTRSVTYHRRHFTEGDHNAVRVTSCLYKSGKLHSKTDH